MDNSRRIATPGYHLGRTFAGLRMGPRDPTFQAADGRIRLALDTEVGGATLAITPRQGGLDVRAHGPGATVALEGAESILGLEDPASSFVPTCPRVRALVRRHAGMHLPRLPRVFSRTVQVVLEQLVSRPEATRAWGRITRELGRPAPGVEGLWLPPDPGRLEHLPQEVLVGLGALPRQARTIGRLAREARRLERASSRGPEVLARVLGAIPGIGDWTVQSVLGSALGYADAVPRGDYNLPHAVAWALRGESCGTEARMLELLEPFRGHRYRVIRLLWLSGAKPPRRHPRYRLRNPG